MNDHFSILQAESPRQAAAQLSELADDRIVVVCCRTGNGDWQAGEGLDQLLAALDRRAPVILAFEGEGAVSSDVSKSGDLAIAARGVIFAGPRGDVPAKAALEEGSINRVAGSEQVRKEAVELAESISRLAPKAVMAAKSAVRKGMRLGLEEGLDLERRLFASLFNTADMKEGTSAFLQKRRAEFKGI